ncbi:MAG: hypothetical protein AB1705_17485 [Verrucomicrobiota bacterium]
MLALFSGMLVMAVAQLSALAQTGGPTNGIVTLQAGDNGKGKAKNKPTISERPTVIPRQTETDSTTKGKPDQPGRPSNPQPVPEVKSLVDRFQTAREDYLKQQKELRLLLQDATEEEREVIREQLKELLDRWKEQHREFVQEVKDRAQTMKSELSPDLGRVVDQAKDEGRGR